MGSFPKAVTFARIISISFSILLIFSPLKLSQISSQMANRPQGQPPINSDLQHCPPEKQLSRTLRTSVKCLSKNVAPNPCALLVGMENLTATIKKKPQYGSSSKN